VDVAEAEAKKVDIVVVVVVVMVLVVVVVVVVVDVVDVVEENSVSMAIAGTVIEAEVGVEDKRKVDNLIIIMKVRISIITNIINTAIWATEQSRPSFFEDHWARFMIGQERQQQHHHHHQIPFPTEISASLVHQFTPNPVQAISNK
jgi:hypothetical protein